MNNHSIAIDAETFHSLLELMGEQEISEIIQFFHRDTAVALSSLKLAIQQQNIEKIGIICHKLKSSGLLIGAQNFSYYAQQLEQHRESFDLLLATRELSNLQQEYQAILQWFSQYYLPDEAANVY